MGNIGSVVGSITSPAGMGNSAPFLGELMKKDIFPKLGDLFSRASTTTARDFQATASDLNSALSGLLNASKSPGSPAAGPALEVKALQEVVLSLGFVVVLQDCIKKAQGQSRFNLETAINDLWIKLGTLRRSGQKAVSSQASVSAGLDQRTAELALLGKLIQELSQDLSKVTQNLR